MCVAPSVRGEVCDLYLPPRLPYFTPPCTASNQSCPASAFPCAGYTALCFQAQLSPVSIAKMLNELYHEFDMLAQKHGVYKVREVDMLAQIHGFYKVSLHLLHLLRMVAKPALRAYASIPRGKHIGNRACSFTRDFGHRYHCVCFCCCSACVPLFRRCPSLEIATWPPVGAQTLWKRTRLQPASRAWARQGGRGRESQFAGLLTVAFPDSPHHVVLCACTHAAAHCICAGHCPHNRAILQQDRSGCEAADSRRHQLWARRCGRPWLRFPGRG